MAFTKVRHTVQVLAEPGAAQDGQDPGRGALI